MPLLIALVTLTIAAMNASAEEVGPDPAIFEKGRYLFDAANCYACHTDVDNDGSSLAGGRALETEFGTFYTPNITPDKTTGIGNWSDEDFINALTQGIAPDGSHYYPSFPYLSYQSMTTDDILAIKAYLFNQPAVSQQNRPHELNWYLSEFSLRLWKILNEYIATPVTHEGSRGSYLVDVLGHCNECHTPRNMLGMLKMQHRLQGNEDLSTPDISASNEGIGDWRKQELADLFKYGELPDGDYVADHMGEVVDNSTSKWTDQDLNAVIDYLLTE
ncbi:MAG: cytochrome c [Gammaproteobacteria bacterium]|nr:cytochrome c [Gammaproteobacteria bacterium]